jgi:hypothetical protein
MANGENNRPASFSAGRVDLFVVLFFDLKAI